jgi:DNA-binding Lrp family transcriptional regulator
MTIAFVMISAESGVEEEVLKKLLLIPQVQEAHVLYGVYDILVKVEANSLEELKLIVTRQIRSVDNIEGTMTLLAVEPMKVPDKVPIAWAI